MDVSAAGRTSWRLLEDFELGLFEHLGEKNRKLLVDHHFP